MVSRRRGRGVTTSSGALQGRVCLVTGATSGIGKATAQGLAELGATVLVVGRNEAKTRAVVDQIKHVTGNPSVEGLLADLSSQQQIRTLAGTVLARAPQLHVLVNNAGAIYTKRSLSVDGIEMTFAVDHLAYFLLTALLVDRLKSSVPARIINVASDAHARARIDFDDVQGEHGYRAFRAYGRAKLANILFTYELAHRLAGSGVTANCLHPGVIATGFGRNNGGLLSLGMGLIRPFVKKPEQGAETSIYLASSPDVAEVSGQYFVNKRASKSSPASYDVEVAHRLWSISADMTGLSGSASAAGSVR
jgi:NAD(P)-dependent dehydrogenase (short-subunit alcohol dehydrogenase family)